MSRRWIGVAVVVCSLASPAAADETTTIWDGTYTNEYGGSGGQLCPKGTTSVTVKNGVFTVTWQVSLGNGHVPVATIVGTARESGFVRVTPTLLSRDKLADTLQKLGDKYEDLVKIADETEGTFTGDERRRKLVLRSPSCSASWENDAPLVRPKETAAAKKATAAKAPKPPAPLAAGSTKWDTTYNAYAAEIGDWRCPATQHLKSIAVKKGRFSIPWRLSSSFGEFVVGQLDASIPATGKAKVRAWVSLTELPPELAGKGRSLDTLKAFAPTMTFTTVEGEREAKLLVGKTCRYDLNSLDVAKRKTTASTKTSKSGGSSSGGSSSSTSSSSSASSARNDDDDDDNPKAIRNRGGKGNGLACTYNSDCASDYCKYHICEWEHADGKDYVTGAACGFNSDCASRDCRDKKCR